MGPGHVLSLFDLQKRRQRVEFELLLFPCITGGLHFLPSWSLMSRIINNLIHLPSFSFNSFCNCLGILSAANIGVIIRPSQNVHWKTANLNSCLVTIVTPD